MHLQKEIDLDGHCLFRQQHKMPVTFADFFCGLGAFHTAFSRDKTDIDYQCVYAGDIDERVRKIYEENHGILPGGDIMKVIPSELPDFDILCAGFPCQPFSIAGKKEGFLDKNRGNLFSVLLTIIDAKQPSVLMLENVKNMETIHKGETFRAIVGQLEARGYNVSHRVIDSRYYGSPQSRHRIYMVCSKEGEYVFPEVSQPIVPVSTVIDPSVDTWFDYEAKYSLEECTGTRGMMKYKLMNKATGKGGRQGERVYTIDDCGPTICASSGGPGAKTGLYEVQPGKIRTLTVPETLQMFGFSPDYKYETLAAKKRMLFYLGNSIVVNVLDEMVKGLSSVLGSHGDGF